MTNMLIEAHRVAQFIEWQHAKELSKAMRGRQTPETLYDPLAATCLGDYLYRRLCPAAAARGDRG